jgi:hypothetical protein
MGVSNGVLGMPRHERAAVSGLDGVFELVTRAAAALLSRRMKRPWRSRRLAFALFAVVPIACGKVDGSPDNSFDCDQPVASYCAAQSAGCPASDAPADLCAWLARRGGNPTDPEGEPPGYALTCEEMPERKDFSVVESDGLHSFVFALGSLSYVFDESGTASHCAAGPQHGALGRCTFVHFGDILPCAADVADGGTE